MQFIVQQPDILPFVCSLFGIGNLSDHALNMFRHSHICNHYCVALGLEGNFGKEKYLDTMYVQNLSGHGTNETKVSTVKPVLSGRRIATCPLIKVVLRIQVYLIQV